MMTKLELWLIGVLVSWQVMWDGRQTMHRHCWLSLRLHDYDIDDFTVESYRGQTYTCQRCRWFVLNLTQLD